MAENAKLILRLGFMPMSTLTAMYVGIRHRMNLQTNDPAYINDPQKFKNQIMYNMFFHAVTWPYFWCAHHDEGYVLPKRIVDRVDLTSEKPELETK